MSKIAFKSLCIYHVNTYPEKNVLVDDIIADETLLYYVVNICKYPHFFSWIQYVIISFFSYVVSK